MEQALKTGKRTRRGERVALELEEDVCRELSFYLFKKSIKIDAWFGLEPQTRADSLCTRA